MAHESNKYRAPQHVPGSFTKASCDLLNGRRMKDKALNFRKALQSIQQSDVLDTFLLFGCTSL
jgi:hypothetical protein